MHIRPASSVAKIKPYFFSTLDARITQLRKDGMDVIRLDMGSPDLPPTNEIIEILCNSARLPNKHSYTPSGGSAEFMNAIAVYYQRRFGVTLDQKTEALGLIGSKEGIFNIHHVLLDPGNLVLLPDPCYPVYWSGVSISNCDGYIMPLLKKNNFLPDLDRIPPDIAKKAKLMWLNYPNNPTGAVADLSFFAECIDFAQKYDIIIAHDAPYVDVTFDGYKAPSILEVPGAKDVAVEFNSLSKTYNMAGWRVGMVVGNPEIVKLLRTYKSQIDSSLFAPIMDASIAALMGEQGWLVDRNNIYQERRDILVEMLLHAGFKLDSPKAALYIWAKLPDGYGNTMDFCEKLLEKTGVSITPGGVYGISGNEYIRISIVTPTDRIKEATERMLTWMIK